MRSSIMAVFVVASLGGCIQTPNNSLREADAGADDERCVPGRREACPCPQATQGTQECDDDGTFGECSCEAAPACEAGVVEREDCDDGSRSRSCEAEGRWGPWDACRGPCRVGEAERQACGHNDRGEQARACEAGQWSEWGACEDPDQCADGASDAEACEGGGGERVRPCVAGQWGEWRGCQAACEEGAGRVRECGINGAGLIQELCRGGQWQGAGACRDPDECEEGVEELEICGISDSGQRLRACVDGRWSAWSPCADPDARCDDGALEEVPCGLNRRGRQRHRCEGDAWGAWSACEDPDGCVDGANQTERCPAGELRQRTCTRGAWGPWPMCREAPCADGTPPPCERCPAPRVAVEEVDAEVGDIVLLDGAPSVGAVRWEWVVVERPEGSGSQPVERLLNPAVPEDGGVPDDTVTPTALFFVDLAGVYVIELRVRDAGGLNAPGLQCAGDATVIIDSRETEGIAIQITWTTPEDPNLDDDDGGDLDLYLRHPMAQSWTDPVWACHWSNVTPDWPPLQDPRGDPSLDRDDTRGPGPENISVAMPTDGGPYRVGVHYFRAGRNSMIGPSLVTLRVFLDGELAWETEEPVRVLGESQMWEAVDIFWGAQPRVVEVNNFVAVPRL